MRIILFLALFLSSAVGVYAGDLGVSIRMDSQKTGNSPLPILVTVRTGTGVVENNLNITVDSGWVIAGSVVVSTSGLPSGVTPLPSISNGIASGQNISFTIGDLASGIDYGFYITDGIGLNPEVGTKTWVFATNGDAIEVGVAVSGEDQVQISGRVGANATDFQLNITSNKSNNLSKEEIVTYQIDYGTYLLGAVKPLQITGTWSRGTVVGSPNPSVDIVDYVVGSGTTGYGGVVPVIDLVNRKIVWTISNFPANTINQKVSFQLQVNNTYSGSSNVDFEVTAILNGANVVTMDSAISQVYEPSPLPTLTPTKVSELPSPTPTSGSVVTGAVTVTTPTPSSAPILEEFLKISQIDIVSLSDSGTRIAVAVNKTPSQILIEYGESINKFNKSLISVNKLKKDFLTLDGLIPNTEYFFKLKIKNESGESVNSEIFTFRTAKISDIPAIDKNSVILSVTNNIILDTDDNGNGLNSVVLIPNTEYALRLRMSQPELINQAKILVKNTKVLGINTVYGAEPNANTVDLMEIDKNGLFGHLVSPKEIGYYEVLVRVADINGNIFEEKIGQLRVVEPLRVTELDGSPIENSKVTIYRFNKTKKIYEIISSNFLGMKNPSYTEQDGRLLVNFLEGKYEIEVSEFGYQTKVVRFVVGLGETDVLPVVILDKAKFNLISIVGYYRSVISNVMSFSEKYVNNLLTSRRFFSLISGILLFLTIFVVNFYLTKNLNLYWWMLPVWIFYRLVKKISKNLYGKVIDITTKKPVPNAVVFLVDGIKNKILMKVSTNIIGEFEANITKLKLFKIIIKKDGYKTTNILDYTYDGLVSAKLELAMENNIGLIEAIKINYQVGASRAFGFGITVVLVLVLLVEFGFINSFGISKVWPWLMTDILLIWKWISMNYGKN